MDAMRTFLRSTTITAVVAIAAAVAIPPHPADAQVVAARWDRGYHGRGHYHAPPRGPWFARPYGHHGWRHHGWHRHGWRHHGYYNSRPWAYRPVRPPYAYGYGYGYRY
jgi:hypothetical protein